MEFAIHSIGAPLNGIVRLHSNACIGVEGNFGVITVLHKCLNRPVTPFISYHWTQTCIPVICPRVLCYVMCTNHIVGRRVERLFLRSSTAVWLPWIQPSDPEHEVAISASGRTFRRWRHVKKSRVLFFPCTFNVHL